MNKIMFMDKKVRLILSNKKVDLPIDIQKEIDSYWQELIINKPWFSKGKIYCVSTINNNSDEIVINIDDSDYAHYLYGYNQNRKYICKNIFVGTLIETIDDYYMLGRTNDKTEIPKEIRLTGSGAFDSVDFCDDNVLFNAALREMKEETGFNLKDDCFEKKHGFYLITGGKRKSVGIIFRFKFSKNKEEVKNIFCHLTDKDNEFTELIFVKKDRFSIDSFFENEKFIEYVPSILYADIENRL